MTYSKAPLWLKILPTVLVLLAAIAIIVAGIMLDHAR
jgi:hypothetical protein